MLFPHCAFKNGTAWLSCQVSSRVSGYAEDRWARKWARLCKSLCAVAFLDMILERKNTKFSTSSHDASLFQSEGCRVAFAFTFVEERFGH